MQGKISRILTALAEAIEELETAEYTICRVSETQELTNCTKYTRGRVKSAMTNIRKAILCTEDAMSAYRKEKDI